MVEPISLFFEAHEEQKPDIYPGEIFVGEETGTRRILTILEVESAKPLFDVDIEVLPQYKTILPGSDFFIESSIFNIRGFGRVDVFVEYTIKDFQGNVIAMEDETLAVETEVKFSRELSIPRDIAIGTYIVSVKVIYGDSVGMSSDVFEVKPKTIKLYPVIKDYSFYMLLAVVASAFLIYKLGLMKKKDSPRLRRDEKKTIEAKESFKKLEKELQALEKAYKSGFISESSYNNDRERIENQMNKLK
jgi:hypothetical protein